MAEVRVWAVPAREAAERAGGCPSSYRVAGGPVVGRDGLVVDGAEVPGIAEAFAGFGVRLVVGPPAATYEETVGVGPPGPAGLSYPRCLPRPAGEARNWEATIVDLRTNERTV